MGPFTFQSAYLGLIPIRVDARLCKNEIYETFRHTLDEILFSDFAEESLVKTWEEFDVTIRSKTYSG